MSRRPMTPSYRWYLLLRRLGFNSYKAYLKSPLWFRIRERVFRLKGRRCYLCREGATIIHHLDYSPETMEGKTLVHLVPLCRRCHESIEFRGKVKRTMKEVQAIYNARRKKRG